MIIDSLSSRFKSGGLSKEIMDSIGIKNETDERKFYDILKSLRTQGKVKRFLIGKRKVYYLPRYEKEAKLEWKTNDDIQFKQELENIYPGYVFVEKEVIRQGKGLITPYEEDHRYYLEILPYSLLPIVPFLPDNQDVLVFLIENLNDYPIKEIGASIFIDKYSPKDCIKSENCTLKKDAHTYHIKCDELLPNETAFAVIPLEKLDVEFIGEKWNISNRPCKVKGWYKNSPLIIREGRLTVEDKGTSPSTEIEWKKK